MKKLNFRFIVYVLLCAVIMPLFCVVISPFQNIVSAGDFNIQKEENKITMITGDFVGYKVDSENDVYNILDNFKDTFKFPSSKDALKFNKKVKVITGDIYKFDQYYNGIKVYGSQVNVNVNSDGRVTSINCSYHTNISVNTNPQHSIEEAKNEILNNHEVSNLSFIEKMILPEQNGVLTYVFEGHMLGDIYKIFISCDNLEVKKQNKATASLTSTIDELPSLSDYNREKASITYTNVNGSPVTLYVDKYVHKTSGESFYLLGDSERKIYVTDGENQDDHDTKYYASHSVSGAFNDQIAVRAYDYIMQCYDFYLDSNNFGVSIDGLTNPRGDEITLIAIVHYDRNYENAAFYLPSNISTTGYFYFGDGKASAGTGSFVNGLDVVGHEYQHAITDSITQLTYANESGAICEAYSDIFGACIEGYELTDSNFWRMGEDIFLADNEYFRDMSNPTINGCTASYENLYPLCDKGGCSEDNCDNGGVHYNSTLMTYATYIMYQQDPTWFTKSNILKLWYQTLPKLSEEATFVDFARLMLQTAEELNYSEENILDIEFAFASIDIPGYSGVKVWGDYSLQYLQGFGTLAYPYLINSEADLATVAYYINVEEDESYATARYKVNVDLNLKNIPWLGIGTSTTPFNGTFNGGGKTINGLNLSCSNGTKYAGLFNYTGENAYIYDVRVGDGSTTTNAEYAGAVAGLLNGTISGCSSSLNIIGNNVGGLAGLVINKNGDEKIVNSFTTCDLEGNIVGGLVSTFSTPKSSQTNRHSSGYIASCYTSGNINGLVVGGLVGQANAIIIANCISVSTIRDTGINAIVGGLLGLLKQKDVLNTTETISATVENMILSAKVAVRIEKQNNSARIGLLIGKNEGDLNKGTLFIENSIVKKQESYGYCSTSLDLTNIKLVNTKISTDNIFEGDFNFDDEKYYNNKKNWSYIKGLESFDLTLTYKIGNKESMPVFRDSEFWESEVYEWIPEEGATIAYLLSFFNGGDGSKDNPYEIKTAAQFALMAYLVNHNSACGSYNYELVADIDLSGKIWTGIGCSQYSIIDGEKCDYVAYPFTGTFNGNGHTISNLTSASVYSVKALNSSGSNYTLTEYYPALFGITQVLDNGGFVNPTIKNVNLENVNNKGSYVAAIVSQANIAVTLENISVYSGTINSNFIAGGLVSIIDGINLDATYSSYSAISNIINCTLELNIAGKISGAIVGYATNASAYTGSTLNIINCLNKGNVFAFGEDIESKLDSGVSYYYKPIAGGFVGVCLLKNLNIYNSINLGEIISYNKGGYIAGFIGALGLGGTFVQDSINITIDGCKQLGNVYYVFDGTVSSAGNIIGSTHNNLNIPINVEITETTYTNQTCVLIKDNRLGSLVSINSNLVISSDEIGEGELDIYTTEYYSNSKYFNLDYQWSENQISKLFIAVIFKNDKGEELLTILLLNGETSIDTSQLPSVNKEPTKQYEYVFNGWSEDLSNITHTMTVKPIYTIKTREYTVEYLDEKGNLVESKTLKYADKVNQSVSAPEKKSGFLFKYTFLRWGEEGQTVSGDIEVKPVYKISLTLAGKIVLITILLCVSIIIYKSVKKKQFS